MFNSLCCSDTSVDPDALCWEDITIFFPLAFVESGGKTTGNPWLVASKVFGSAERLHGNHPVQVLV